MSPDRTTARALARAALAADPRMSGFAMLPTWTGTVMAEQLPVIGVVTPQERVDPQTLDCFQCALRLQVVAKRLGGDDLEDLLDLDAAAIEASVTAAMLGQGLRCLPEEIVTTLNGEGEQKIGTVLVTFGLVYLRRLPQG